MKTIILFFVIVLSITKIQAQSISPEIIAACGDFYSNSTAILSFSEGVLVDEFFISSPTTSIKNETLVSNSLKIYPNPFSHSTTIEIKSEIAHLKSEIFIYDVLGQVVHQQTLNSKLETLNLQLPSGIYFYKLNNEKKEIIGNGKLIIQ